MKLLQFGYTSSGKLFSTSLIVFTVYSLTNVLRWMSVVGVQMPIILFCYVLLLVACSKQEKGSSVVSRVLSLTVVLLLFDFFFIYMQEKERFVNASIEEIIGFNYSIFVSFFPLLYIASGLFDQIDKRKFLNFIYVIALITSVTTIMGTYMYETPCRELATPDNLELDILYKMSNIGGYGFIYFLVLIIPILVGDILKHFKIYKLLLLGVFAFCISRSEYTTALLLTIVGVGIVLFFSTNKPFLKVIVAISLIIVSTYSQEIINSLGQFFGEGSYTLGSRFDMLSEYGTSGDVSGDLEERQILYLRSLESFFENPLVGNYFSNAILGGHSEILDYLGCSGLVGVFFLVLFINYLRKMTIMKQINIKDPFIKSTLVVAFILAALNTFLSPDLYFALLIVPLLVSDEQ